MPASMKQKQSRLGWITRFIPFLTRIGVVRAALTWEGTPGELTYLESQPKFADAMLSELNSIEESGAQTKAESPSLGDLPIIVLTAGVDGTGDPAMADLWRNQLQPELVRLSTKGKQITVEGSTHMIPTEKPQAIVDAVREMLETLQRPLP
jgi:pimeloyl-ACP methyl ester carboxylesterase